MKISKTNHNRRRKLIIIFTLILLFITAFFIYRNLDSKDVFMSKEEKYFYNKLKEFKESEKDSIALKELTSFEWDEVCVTSTYSAIEQDSYMEFYLGKKKQLKIISDQKYFNKNVEGKNFNLGTIKGNSYFYFGGSDDSKEILDLHRIKDSNCRKNGFEASFDNLIKIKIEKDKAYEKYYGEAKFYGINFFY